MGTREETKQNRKFQSLQFWVPLKCEAGVAGRGWADTL